MKKIILIIIVLIISVVILYTEGRNFYTSPTGRYATVWKTYNNVCYVMPYKYYGLIPPSNIYIKTNNTSSGVSFIWKGDTVFVEAEKGSKIVNQSLNQIVLIDYNINKSFNDSLYTYLDSSLHLRRYKKGIDMIAVPIENMGAL